MKYFLPSGYYPNGDSKPWREVQMFEVRLAFAVVQYLDTGELESIPWEVFNDNQKTAKREGVDTMLILTVNGKSKRIRATPIQAMRAIRAIIGPVSPWFGDSGTIYFDNNEGSEFIKIQKEGKK